MAIAALSTPVPCADIWFTPPSNDDTPAGPRGCRWRMVIDTLKANGMTPLAVAFAKAKIAGRDLDDMLDELIMRLDWSLRAERAVA